MLVGVECSSPLLVQRWKLMVIKQQLQGTNYAASLGRSQAGSLVIANREAQLVRSDRGHLIIATTF